MKPLKTLGLVVMAALVAFGAPASAVPVSGVLTSTVGAGEAGACASLASSCEQADSTSDNSNSGR